MSGRFSRLSGNRKFLLFEAAASLALARLALVFMPFRTLAEKFGTVVTADVPAMRTPSSDEEGAIRDIGWAVTRAARWVPFKAVCLPQAIAAKSMLDRRGIASVMHFGVTKQKAPMEAHAWLDAGPIEITGYPVGPEYVEIARFL